MNSKITLQKNDRIQQLQERMRAVHCDMCLVENPLDLLYLTGQQLSAGKLFVHSKESILFVDGRYLQIAQEQAPMPAELEKEESMLFFLNKHACKTLWFDGAHTSYDRFAKLQKLHVKLESKSAFFKTLRSIKDASEIEKMKKSAQLLWRGFEYICSLLTEGITEKEISKRFEIFCLTEGGEGLAFESIIAFGAHSSMPHYRSADDTPLCSGDIVLIDIGVVVENYHSDMTRVLFYKNADSELQRLYAINKAAHQAALDLCRPGVAMGMLDRAARDVMAKAGVESLFLHSLGHGIGLETHEFPRIKYDGEDKDVILQPGMIFTIEPGLYVSGKGGVRYEDTVMITETGCENFYPNTEEAPVIS